MIPRAVGLGVFRERAINVVGRNRPRKNALPRILSRTTPRAESGDEELAEDLCLGFQFHDDIVHGRRLT